MQKTILIFFLLASCLFYGFNQAAQVVLSLWLLPFVSLLLTGVLISSAGVLGFVFKPVFGDGLVGQVSRFMGGLWLLAVIAFVLGLAGLIDDITAVLILISPSLFGWRIIKSYYYFIVRWLKSLNSYKSEELFFVFFIGLLLFLLFAFASVPALDFDVLEYHLGVPADYVRLGKITFLHNNIYAAFPQAMETLAYLLLSATRDQIITSIIVQYINVWLTIGLVIVVYQITLHISLKRINAFMSALLVVLMPWTIILAQKFYVEIPLSLCFLSSIYFVIKGVDKKNTLAIILLVCIGSCVKYNMLFFGLPIICVFIFLGDYGCQKIITCVQIIIVPIVINPWLWFNWFNTGNPFYPLLCNFLPSGTMRASDVARWNWAHKYHSDTSFLMSIADGLNHYWVISPIVIFLFFMSWKFLFKNKSARLFCLSAIIWLVLWVVATHRIARFLYPAYLLIMVFVSVGFFELVKLFGKRIIYGFVLISIFTNLVISIYCMRLKIPVLIGSQSYDAYFKTSLSQFGLIKYLEKHPQIDKVFSVADAKSYYYPLDISFKYQTVFMSVELENILKNGFVKYLQLQKIKYFLVDYAELNRYQNSYAYMYKGKRYTGYLPVSSLKELSKIVANSERVWPKAGASNQGLILYKIGD